MKVAHVLPFGVHPYSGLLDAVVELSAALARMHHQVELWRLQSEPDPLTQGACDALRLAGVERVEIPVRTSWWLGRAAEHAIARRDVEVVHLHGVFSPLNDLVARRLRVPYLFSPHGGYSPAVLAYHRTRKLVFKRLLELRKLREASLVLALSDAEKEDIRSFGYEGPIEVVPNGVIALPPAAPGESFRQELGLDAKTPLAIFVGRLDVQHKGLDVLVRAVQRTPGWHLALVGPDWKGSRHDLGELVQRLGLARRVFLVPPRRGAALREALEAADLFVLPSRWEGQSLALLQALSCGLPALVSAEVERTLGVAAAGAGWLAEASDLPRALDAVAGIDDAEWARRSLAARRLASTFRWDHGAIAYSAAVVRAGLGSP